MDGSLLPPFLFAIFTASLVGSAHCVGMCGPFAIVASTLGNGSSYSKLAHLFAYHLGRGITYGLMGVLAGLAGSWFDLGGSVLGWQRSAAWIMGIGMILFGAAALFQLSKKGSIHWELPRWIGGKVQKLYRLTGKLPQELRAFSIGMVTGYLPCGWLYAFLLLAIGTASPLGGVAVMAAFWVGTIPALSILSLGIDRLPGSWKKMVPHLTAVMLIAAGIFTVSIRAQASLENLNETIAVQETAEEKLEAIQHAPLPCCHTDKDETAAHTATDEEGLPPCCRQK